MALEQINPTEDTPVKNTDIKTPNPETQNTTENSQEVKDDQVLEELFSKYNIDVKELFKKYNLDEKDFSETLVISETKQRLHALKTELNGEKLDASELAEKLFQEIMNNKLKSNPEKILSIDGLSEGIESSRVDTLKEYADQLLNKELKEYPFIDGEYKEIVKLAISNELIENGLGDLIKSTTGGIDSLFAVAKKEGANYLEKVLKEKLSDGTSETKNTTVMKEVYEKTLSKYTSKFDDINTKFNDENLKLTDENKKAIISNIDIFNNPLSLRDGIEKFDVSKIDVTNTTLNETLKLGDTKALSEYLTTSRENIANLADNLARGGDTLNGVLNLGNNEKIGAGIDGLMQVLLKIPILGKLIAGYLGLDQENPMEDYKESKKGALFLKSIKNLGIHNEFEKNGDTKKSVEKAGVGDFEKTNFEIDFSENKKNLNKLGKLFPGLEKKEDINNFWLNAFGKEGFKQKDKPTFKIEGFEENNKDNKITNSEFDDMLDNAISKYEKDLKALKEKPKSESDKEGESTPASGSSESTSESPKAEVERKTETEIYKWNENSKNAIDFLKTNKIKIGEHKEKTILENNFTGVFGDLYQFNDISLYDIVGNSDLKTFISDKLGEGSYKDSLESNDENETILIESLNVIKGFIKEKNITLDRLTSSDIGFLREQSSFTTYLDKLNPNKTTPETSGQA